MECLINPAGEGVGCQNLRPDHLQLLFVCISASSEFPGHRSSIRASSKAPLRNELRKQTVNTRFVFRVDHDTLGNRRMIFQTVLNAQVSLRFPLKVPICQYVSEHIFILGNIFQGCLKARSIQGCRTSGRLICARLTVIQASPEQVQRRVHSEIRLSSDQD